MYVVFIMSDNELFSNLQKNRLDDTGLVVPPPFVATVLTITDNDARLLRAPAPDTDLTSEHASSRAQL